MTPLSFAAMRGTALGGAAAVALSAALAQVSPVATALREGRSLSGVLIGTDIVDHARHSDTLLLWRYSPLPGRLDVLSIPRDTRVSLPGYKFRRINEVFTYHYGATKDPGRASRETAAAVARLLNLQESGPSPSYYVHVDYDGFRRVVDILGGLRVHVDEPMHYDDNAGDLHIHFDPGDRLLGGQEALEYVRFRGKSGDRGRILRQMEFIKAVARKVSSPLLCVRWPRLVVVALQSLHTNFRPWDVLFLALEAKHVRPDRVNPWLLPGRPKGAYWEVDEEKTAFVLAQVAEAVPSSPEIAGPLGRAVTVKVRNGTRRAGLARRAAVRLRAAGFDVLDWADYNARQGKTRVVDRSGVLEKAHRVARALGTDSVFSDVDPGLRTDVEVILGDDYREETTDGIH